MPKYTSAYSAFIQRLDEISILLRFSFAKERKDAVGLRDEINALCRGSVVLLSAHLEAYIKELGELALDSLFSKKVSRSSISPRFFYHISKDKLFEIKDTTDNDKIAEKVFTFIGSEIDFWSQSGPFPKAIPADQFNKGFSNPAYNKIKAYFNRFGYSEYPRDLNIHMKGQYAPAVNMVDHLVHIRNKIAHGDPAATKTPAEIRDMTAIVRKYCAATDAVFATWWKTKYCSIR